MTKTLENIPAEEVSRVLVQQGIAPGKPVTVIIEESLADIARRTRRKAKQRGMTEQIFQELMKAR